MIKRNSFGLYNPMRSLADTRTDPTPPWFAGLSPIPPVLLLSPTLTLLLVSAWQGFLSDGVANATSAVNATGEVLKAAAAAVAPLPLLEDAAGDEFGN